VDTRGKIVAKRAITPDEAAGWCVVRGYFDPLLAWHAGRLAALRNDGRKLAVWVDDPPDPLLPSAARLQLVAALDGVDLVVAGNGGDPIASQLEDWRAEEAMQRAALVRRVGDRHGRS
jgi:hypothetical protein